MLKELENETKIKNMEAIPRLRARSTSASRPKPRQYIPNESGGPSAKRFNRSSQGNNRCTSRYEIYNSTTRPFGKSYRDMVAGSNGSSAAEKTTDHRPPETAAADDTCASGAESSRYATACCSEAEPPTDDAEDALQAAAAGEDDDAAATAAVVTEARNYDVRREASEADETQRLLSTEMVRRADGEKQRRLMYAMPATSNWATYAEDQLTYEPGDGVRRETVTRSRSLFDLQPPGPDGSSDAAAASRPPPPAQKQRLFKAASENQLERCGRADDSRATRKPVVVETTPAKKLYSSALNLTLRTDGRGVEYESRSDPRPRGAQGGPARSGRRQPLQRPKSVDFLAAGRPPGTAAGAHRPSHADALRKHFYYNPLQKQTKQRLNDDELPDPDKVLSTRRLFQKELKIPLPPHMNDRNPKTGPRPTHEVRLVPPADAAPKECGSSADVARRGCAAWTDSGSVSSGVGSDGSFDASDRSSETNGGGRPPHRACGYSSDDDDDDDEDDCCSGKTTTVEIIGRPVSADILDKIRRFGTSVTYYGGKVISSSRGASCSPMTMTIMDEIRHQQREETVKLRLVKSNSCGSRMELTAAEPRRTAAGSEVVPHAAVEPIREEEDVEDEARGGRRASCAKTAAAERSSEDETSSWKALIVIRKKTPQNAVPAVFDMEFEEFEVLQEH